MKISRIIVAVAFAATMFSCTKENPREPQRVSLSFDVAYESSASKAVLDGNDVEFEAGDQIGVWDGTSMNCFTTVAGGAHASFSGTAASAASYILVSPYSENYSVSGSVVTYSIPEIQVATPGSADPNALVSMVKVTGTLGEAVLYNCVGLLKVEVPDGLTVKEIQVGGGKGSTQGICGTFTFNTNNQALNVVGSMPTNITLVPQAGQSVIAPGTYYVAVRPFTYNNGLVLAYVNADNQLCKRTTANSVAVARNHIRPVGSLNTADFAAVTGRATLRYADSEPQFTGRIKKLAGGSGIVTDDDNVVKKIVFKAHTLYSQAYKADANLISNGPNSDVQIHAWIDGDTAYVCTEAPIITLYSTSGNLFRDFAALEEVSFNDVNTMANTSFEYMFRNCSSLKSVDFGNADFSKVTNFSYMFYTGTSSVLEYVDLGETATTAATTMQSMFNNNQNLKYLNLGPNFTLAATHTNMFLDAARQTSIDAGGDDAKKCQLYASQAFYNDVRANENSFNAARFSFHAQ